MIVCDLVIDGNYILSKLTFTLHKNNILYGSLYTSLEMCINNYRKLFPFAKVYLVSDSKEYSWRKSIYKEYKSHRKKDSDIDWNFVINTYDDFKSNLSKIKIKVLEYPQVEGDDWISFIVKKSNEKGRSTFIISNDYDIKQIVGYSIDPLYINIMSNEMMNKQKIFLPKNYQIFLNKLSNTENDDIFNLNDDNDFLFLLNSFLEKYDIHEVDPIESLIVKIISGDQSDNITSAWSVTKNGKKRGIGNTGALSIIKDYKNEFGEFDLSDPDIFDNIADLICEKKNLSKTSIDDIKSNIKFNMSLINLSISYFPDTILNIMKNEYDK